MIPAAPPSVPAAWTVSADLLAALLADQHPALAGQPIVAMGEGWDNVVFGVGEHWVFRLPRRPEAIPLLERELRWLPTFADRLPLPTSVAEWVGAPTPAFPHPWAGSRLIPGQTGDQGSVDPRRVVPALAAFLQALHQPGPVDGPVNPYRSIPPRARRPTVERLADLAPIGLLDRWEAWAAAPDPAGPKRWVHGDLHPRNLIVADGALMGVIDWGDLHVGDVAVDLGAALLLFAPRDWPAFAAAYGPVDPATAPRALAWATVFGLLLADAGRQGPDPAFARVGGRALAGLAAGALAGWP